ncbi:MAG: DeoR/GlpR transcriptional regulator [Selenomonadaceae bacterium]|nr:DeoR/GlpR transcriptional regulator [Selenomonadaceae bacterium]
MFLEERQAKILEMLNRDGKVLVKELAEIFGVTEDSIRKDLSSLELDGKLKRTYGGAVSLAEKLQMTEAHTILLGHGLNLERKDTQVVHHPCHAFGYHS